MTFSSSFFEASRKFLKFVAPGRALVQKGVLFLSPLAILVFLVGSVEGQTEFVRNYEIRGTAYRDSDRQIPLPGAVVLLKARSSVESASGFPPSYSKTVVQLFVADSNGNFGPIVIPCHVTTVPGNEWNSSMTVRAQILGGGSTGSGGSTDSCTRPESAYYQRPFSQNPDFDRSNAGPTCSKAGKSSASSQPSHDVGKPVNTSNGNMWLAQKDYDLPGIGEPISVSRFYNSLLQESGVFGFGWASEFDESIQNFSDEYLTLRTSTGRGVYFSNMGGVVFDSVSVGFHAQIVKNVPGNTYTLTYKDGRVHKFRADGRLDWKRDRNGNQTTLNYDANGVLTGVTDSNGNTLTVSVAGGFVQSISDPMGTVATYTYCYEIGGCSDFPNVLKEVTYQDGSKFKFDYVVRGTKTLLQAVKDASDNVVEAHDYHPDGKAATSVGGVTNQDEVEKFSFSYVSTTETHVTDGLGRVSKYFFDKSRVRNVLVRSEGLCGCGGSPGSQFATYSYDDNLNVILEESLINTNVGEAVEKVWRINQYTYDPLNPSHRLTANEKIRITLDNKVFSTTDMGTEKFTYNQFGQVLTYQDKIDSPNNHNTITIEYDANGNLKKSTDSLGHFVEFGYPKVGNRGLPDTVKDKRGYVSRFNWYPSGLLEWFQDPYLKKTNFEYDARGRLTKVKNALPLPDAQRTTTYNYFDDSQRKVEVVHPNGDKITYQYDVRRLLQSVTDERGKVTSYEFDSAYRLKKIIDPLLHLTEFDYDLMSNLKWKKNGLGQQTDYRYDDFNRLREIEYPAADSSAVRLKEQFEYDQIGRIKKLTDTANRVTTVSYDDSNRTRHITNADGETTTTVSNARGFVTQVTDAKNQIYAFIHDPFGRVKSQSRAGGTMTFEYDQAGNLSARTDYAGLRTTYEHDQLNRLTQINYLQPLVPGVIPAPSQMPIRTASYSYDEISRLKTATNEVGTVSFTYDTRNRIETTTDVFGHTIRYDYFLTPTENRVQTKFDGVVYSQRNFDDADRPQSIVDASDNTTFSFGYDNADRVTSRILPNGVSTTYEYDFMGRLKRLADAGGSTNLNREYSYNSASQIQQISGSDPTKTFGYDNVDRLTSVTNDIPTRLNSTYIYDDVGNRASSEYQGNENASLGNLPVTQVLYNYQAGQFNRLASTVTTTLPAPAAATAKATFAYDANGNLTRKAEAAPQDQPLVGTAFWSFLWDHDNRLTMAWDGKDRVRYRYDALGRRVQRVISTRGENTKFIYDGDDVLVDDNTGVLTKYINGPGVDNKLKMTTGGTVRYFLSDHLGSTNALTDANGTIVEDTQY